MYDFKHFRLQDLTSFHKRSATARIELQNCSVASDHVAALSWQLLVHLNVPMHDR